ncbi:MAG: hypothetical protein NTU73_02690 [Ignavibacteriae bacterium]|nr:hypothetical protein [Ignavibacteriota bacterium]
MKYSTISAVRICTFTILFLLLSLTTTRGQDASSNDVNKEGLKVGVVKNSCLVKVEIKGKAEVLNLKDIYSFLGVNKLDRTYRSIASLEQMKVQGKSANIDGEAMFSVISGNEGIILLIVDANNPKNFTYTGLKQRIVRKGETKDLYHSQEEGIQRPDLVTITRNGVAWVSYGEGGLYNLNFVPFVIPKYISTTFEGSTSTQQWDIKVLDGNISVVDGDKVLLKAELFNGFSDVADSLNSMVKWSGKTRNTSNFTFNIVEDTRSMAGNDVLLEFSEADLGKLINLSDKKSSWESIEIVKPLSNVIRNSSSYIPHVVIARNGIGIVEIPNEGDDIRYYHLGNKPFDPNEKDNPKVFKPAFSINALGNLFGYIEVAKTDDKKQYLALFSPFYRFGIKIELNFAVKSDFSILATSNTVFISESNKNIKETVGIFDLQML